MKTNDEFKNDTATKSQNSKILKHLMRGSKITPLEALSRFDCFRLGARIHDLKAKGYDIKAEMHTMTNGKKVARYWIPKESRTLI
jgi:hypothetical protein